MPWRSVNSAPQPIDGGPWCRFKNPNTGKDIIIKDSIADAFLQQILVAAGGVQRDRHAQPQRRLHFRCLGRPGGRYRHCPGRQLVRYGGDVLKRPTALRPNMRAKTTSIPGSEILSAEMMLRHMGWKEAADLIIRSMEKSMQSKKVTYDFARLMDGATNK